LVARDQAQVEGAERDVRRYTDLVAKNATPVTNLDNAKTQADVYRAAIISDTALLNNLKVQLSYCTIRAPISGRIGAASVKIGNFVRPADTVPLATVNQTKPVYVTFSLPQRALPQVREAMRAGTGRVEARARGDSRAAVGKLAMIDNTVDATTGMIAVRAVMDNADEMLWPGTLVTVTLTLRVEEAVAIPSAALQVGQSGSFLFVVKDGTAEVRLVTVDRVAGAETVLKDGLNGGETVVVDGQLQLANGTKVSPRQPKRAEAGS
jgi:RND family efflux transporter MFP subunit